jgi:general stress protein 26
VLSPELLEVLRKPLIARLSVIDANGFPHTVPLWFDVDGDDIVIISDRNSRKVDYLANNPKAAVSVGGDPGPDGVIGRGFLLKGIASAEEDPDFRWLRQVTLRYEPPEQAERSIAQWRKELDMMIIRLHVTKVIKVY